MRGLFLPQTKASDERVSVVAEAGVQGKFFNVFGISSPQYHIFGF
jgi:hypothetical protein